VKTSPNVRTVWLWKEDQDCPMSFFSHCYILGRRTTVLIPVRGNDMSPLFPAGHTSVTLKPYFPQDSLDFWLSSLSVYLSFQLIKK